VALVPSFTARRRIMKKKVASDERPDTSLEYFPLRLLFLDVSIQFRNHTVKVICKSFYDFAKIRLSWVP
jgi:hypothetical protein